jgi:hypothetical protein
MTLLEVVERVAEHIAEESRTMAALVSQVEAVLGVALVAERRPWVDDVPKDHGQDHY